MSDNLITRSPEPALAKTGHLLGTGLLGCAEFFVEKYGPAAAHAVIAQLPQWRAYLRPNAPSMGLLGARKYPYAFVGDLVRTMAAVAKVDEDTFIREVTDAGIDRTLTTVARFVLRHLVGPKEVAQRAQQLWDLYHDSGRIVISELTDHGYVSTINEWRGHDVVVCRIAAQARRRVVELSGGKNVRVMREQCVAWGHDACRFRVKWD